MISDRDENARFQSDFYRDKYHGVLRSLLLSVCLIVLLIGGIIYLVLFRAPPQYYATTTDGQIIPMVQAE
jgi:hypothetical protein